MAHHLPMEDFATNVRAALANAAQRAALRRATGIFAERRGSALATVPDWEALRTRARAIKDRVLADLPAQLERFSERAAANGMTVHWAEDGAAAGALVLELARARGVRSCVKSKSMTTEEIRLNDVLERGGITTVETDLGEWIIQLADEVPSHIIVPAIHKPRQDIAALFAERFGSPRDADAESLTRLARAELRRRFAEAGLGISGANFGIVETGSVVIVENEGNARLSTTLPPCHIVVMGIEKLLPALADLPTFLRLLPRSGTGQAITSYISLISAPAAEGQEGPREIHLVLLDNGRSRMLGNPEVREALACIRCGACLNACPVYQQIGGHAYGSVYPGPIGAVISPELFGAERAAKLPYASSLCGACRDVCPVKIDLPALLLHHRRETVARAEHQDFRPSAEARGFRRWAWTMASPRRLALALRVGRLGQRIVLSKGRLRRWARRPAPLLAAWDEGRTLPKLASRSFRELWAAGLEGEATR